MPKGVVTQDRFDWGDDRPPHTPWDDTVIYETHLRGLTMRSPDIRSRCAAPRRRSATSVP